MIRLAAYRGDAPCGEILVRDGERAVIGRSEACALVLKGDRTSREHCTVTGGPQGWLVADAGSSNGTLLNGERITQAPLAPGDVLGVGDFRIEVLAAPDPAGGDAPPLPGPDRTMFSARPGDGSGNQPGEGTWVLTVREGPGQGRTIPLTGRMVVGRAGDCGLVLEDPTVSRQHASLEPGPARVRITALNERNPLFLNGAPVGEAQARDGDTLKLGACLLGLRRTGPPPGPSPDQEPPSRGRMSRKTLLLAAGAALTLLALVLVLSSGPDKGREIMEQEQKKALAVEEAGVRKKITAQLAYGRKYLDQGDPVQALERFKAVLDMDPAEPEAKQMAELARQKIEETERQRQEAERRRKEQRDKVRPLLDQARAALERGNHQDALHAVNQAGDILPGDPEAASLREKIEEAVRQEAQTRTQAEAERRELGQRLADLLAQARRNYDQGHFTEALAGFREVAGLAAGQGEPGSREGAEASRYIPELEDLLARKAAPDLRQGEKFLAQKKYAEAYQSFRKVLDVLPGHAQAREKAQEALRPLEQEARRLYEEGLVYEGIGDQEEAVRRWRAVLTALPDPDNAYVRKAKARLDHWGQRGTP